ncbi:DUF4440 domain-containing protein [Planococcus halotolerans]|uniref:DUF4440 domain-containing protein n=1 Tax=Planococcus halotolerans TaxID=2233542 RepID=A0A365KRM5_9BACL|nr:DUF4440 domain-containing protein [Planococcus halotolerans]QHJ69512.1 DUF4440 domain-containing protein [Planococcus halotolerans]RAZ75462.1 DUF4440 domain-containing protein [Planococcus halotolerans]
MNDLKREIYELECRHISPDVRTSKVKLAEVLDDEFYEFGSSGGIIQRWEYDGDHPLSPDHMELSEFKIHQLGKEAVLTTYRIENKTTGKNTNRSSVWKKRENGWKLFFHQGTVAKP